MLGVVGTRIGYSRDMIKHITKAGRDFGEEVETYCGSDFNQALHPHFWLMDGAPSEGFCTDCLASDELGLDLLSDKIDVGHTGRVRTHSQQTMKAVK